jgi:DNA-binding transcriptional regulator YhcF (GntR family)
MAIDVATWVWEHMPQNSTPGEMLVALALANHAGPDGMHAFPSIATLCGETRLERRTVGRALAELEKKGIIKVEAERTNRFPTTWYFPQFSRRDKKSPQDRFEVTKSRVEPHLEATKSRSGGDNLSPKPSITVIEPSTTPPTPRNGACRWAAAVGEERLATVTARFEAANVQLDGAWLRRTVSDLEHQVPGLTTEQITNAVRSTLFKAEDALGRDNTIRNPRAFVAKELRSEVSEKGRTR